MHLSPEAEERIRNDFKARVNLEPAEPKAWLNTPESRTVGMVRRGETESAGRQSAKKILAIRATPAGDLTDAACRRHLIQRPQALRTRETSGTAAGAGA